MFNYRKNFMEIDKTLGQTIRKARKKKKISLYKLEQLITSELDVDPPLSFVSLGRIETGKQSVSVANLYRIAEALDSTVFKLLEPDLNEIDLLERYERLDSVSRDNFLDYLEFLESKRSKS